MCNVINFINLKIKSIEYYPKMILHDKKISQRCKITVYKKWPYRDKSDITSCLTIWGSDADKCHKTMCKNSVISGVATSHRCLCRLIYKGKPLLDKDGGYIMMNKTLFTLIELL